MCKSAFNLDKFNKDNPVIEPGEDLDDPFVDRVNSREHPDALVCCVCSGIYYEADGAKAGDAVEITDDDVQAGFICLRCSKVKSREGRYELV